MATIQIDDEKLYREITEYCRANGRKIGAFCAEMLRKQLLIEKFGDTPFNKVAEKEDLRIETTTAPIQKATNTEPPVAKVEIIDDKPKAEVPQTEKNDNNEKSIKPTRRRVL